ncbi:MAG: hypothetical protein ABJC89_16530 [Acidobacteriota bacterium]
MKLDTHVHTVHSGHSTLKPLKRLLLESYNSVEDVYRLAKPRGMDLVAITDHDVIAVDAIGGQDGADELPCVPPRSCPRRRRDAVADAAAHRGRPATLVQWGNHGSMPLGWERLSIVAEDGETESKYYPLDRPISLEEYNRGTWRKLTTEGRREPGHPIASRAGWPIMFAGDWNAFATFPVAIDPGANDPAAACRAGLAMECRRAQPVADSL